MQRGLSSLVLLFIVVLGVYILWEANEFINTNGNAKPSPSPEAGATETFCPTGEEGNCNDSNDVFLFTE